MEKKSLGVNFIFNLMKTLMGVVFPLITFPYATRILGPEYIGKVDFAYANISYFSLIAAFGISSYAIREGSRFRDDKKRMNTFVGEILAINFVMVVIAYALFGLALLLPVFDGYRKLMLVFSTTIILTAFGMEWVFNIYEDYKYITIRSFVFQIVAVIVLFTCVRDYSDYVTYAFVLILSSVGSNIMNIVRSRKYIKLKLSFSKNMTTHIKPMCYIFLMNVASSIYLIMDKTMLGYIVGDDAEIGLYGAAIKIINVLVSIFASLRVVMTPRVAYCMKTEPKEADKLNEITAKLILMLSIPCAIGIFFLSKRVLILFAGKEYGPASLALQLLLIDVVIASMNGFLVNQLFIVHRKDRWASSVVIVGAVVNLIMNSITIPLFGKEGAAVSTCTAEAAIFIMSCILARKIFDMGKLVGQLLQSVLASIPMVGIYFAIESTGVSDLMVILVTVLGGIVSYFAMLFVVKNQLVREGISQALAKRKGGKA